jgi:archaellum component FlaC
LILRNEHENNLAKMRQELTLIETRAKQVFLQFESLTREVEPLKVDLLQKLLEEKIKSEARRRGAASLKTRGNCEVTC